MHRTGSWHIAFVSLHVRQGREVIFIGTEKNTDIHIVGIVDVRQDQLPSVQRFSLMHFTVIRMTYHPSDINTMMALYKTESSLTNIFISIMCHSNSWDCNWSLPFQFENHKMIFVILYVSLLFSTLQSFKLQWVFCFVYYCEVTLCSCHNCIFWIPALI